MSMLGRFGSIHGCVLSAFLRGTEWLIGTETRASRIVNCVEGKMESSLERARLP